MTARIDGNVRTEVWTSAVNGPYNQIGGYTVYNAHMTWEAPKNNWQVILQAKNLTGTRNWVNLFDLAQTGGGSVGGHPLGAAGSRSENPPQDVADVDQRRAATTRLTAGWLPVAVQVAKRLAI